MQFKLAGNGNYYLNIRKPAERSERSTFVVKYWNEGFGIISNIKVPKQFIGKKVRVRLEVLDG